MLMFVAWVWHEEESAKAPCVGLARKVDHLYGILNIRFIKAPLNYCLNDAALSSRPVSDASLQATTFTRNSLLGASQAPPTGQQPTSKGAQTLNEQAKAGKWKAPASQSWRRASLRWHEI